MSPEELKQMLENLLGKGFKRVHAATALGYDQDTLESWLSGEAEIPETVQFILEEVKACPAHKRPAAWQKSTPADPGAPFTIGPDAETLAMMHESLLVVASVAKRQDLVVIAYLIDMAILEIERESARLDDLKEHPKAT